MIEDFPQSSQEKANHQRDYSSQIHNVLSESTSKTVRNFSTVLASMALGLVLRGDPASAKDLYYKWTVLDVGISNRYVTQAWNIIYSNPLALAKFSMPIMQNVTLSWAAAAPLNFEDWDHFAQALSVGLKLDEGWVYVDGVYNVSLGGNDSLDSHVGARVPVLKWANISFNSEFKQDINGLFSTKQYGGLEWSTQFSWDVRGSYKVFFSDISYKNTQLWLEWTLDYHLNPKADISVNVQQVWNSSSIGFRIKVKLGNK